MMPEPEHPDSEKIPFDLASEHDFLVNVMDRYGSLVEHFCLSKCSQVDRRLGLDEDIVNEVFFCLWKNLKFRLLLSSVQNDTGQSAAIVLRIAKSRMIDHIRRNQRRKRSITAEVLEHFSSKRDANSDLFVVELELNEAWEKFQCSLSELDREIIRLRVLGKTASQISHELLLSTRSVQRLLERIRNEWSEYCTAGT